MTNQIKTSGTLTYEVTLNAAAKDFYETEILDIIKDVSFNTDLLGFKVYSVEGTDFLRKAKAYKVCPRVHAKIKFNFNIRVNGIGSKNLSEAVCLADVPGVTKVKVKYNVANVTNYFKVETKKTVEAKSDSPVDKAIAHAVDLATNHQNKKGFYRLLQKALKQVKSYNKDLVRVRLNGKASDLIEAALSLQSSAVFIKEEVNKKVKVVSKTRKQTREELEAHQKAQDKAKQLGLVRLIKKAVAA